MMLFSDNWEFNESKGSLIGVLEQSVYKGLAPRLR